MVINNNIARNNRFIERHPPLQDRGRFCVLLTFLYRFVQLIVYYFNKSNIFNQDRDPSPVLYLAVFQKSFSWWADFGWVNVKAIEKHTQIFRIRATAIINTDGNINHPLLDWIVQNLADLRTFNGVDDLALR